MKLAINHESFLFSSAFRSLYAEGIFEHLTDPADDPDALCKSVEHAFHRARQAGITTPLVVGAIPFDKRTPSSLFIPHTHRFLTRETFMQALNAGNHQPVAIRGQLPFPSKEHFTNMVGEAVSTIGTGALQKIVLSRLLTLQTDSPSNTLSVLKTLADQNPSSYLFHAPLQHDATLFGASPELLLRQNGNKIWTTPLAGTIKRSQDVQQDQEKQASLLASKKDRHEHRLVVEDIQRVLTPYCSTLSIPEVPQVLETPKVWHLASPISGTLNQDISPLQLASLLHPTPALCGVPAPEAREIIQALEPFKRGLFGGIVGWSDDQGNGEWAVTIRCGIHEQNAIRLYAGAGIVADSNPEDEWNETQSKLETMLSALVQ